MKKIAIVLFFGLLFAKGCEENKWLNVDNDVFFEPQEIRTETSKEFEVIIKAESKYKIYGFAFDLDYDPLVLQYASIKDGDFFPSECHCLSLSDSKQQPGKVIFGYSLMGDKCLGQAGSGTVTTFKFKAIGQPQINWLSLSNCYLCIIEGKDHAFVKAQWPPASIIIE